MASLSDAFRQFVADPIAKRSPALFVWRLSQLLHERLSGRGDATMRRAIALLRPKAALGPSRWMGEAAIAAGAAQLARDGWHILPFRLPAESIAEISRFAFSTPVYAAAPEDRITLDAADPPRRLPRYEWRINEILALPAVRELLADDALHRLAQEHIGCRPVLTSVTLWLDTVYEGVYDAHVYHYDNDGPAFLKFFIYLTDVTPESGAHNYIQGSHSHLKPASFRRSRRYERDDLLRHYGAGNEMVFAAPAGTILAEDTAGFHRGMTPTARPRLLLQLQYAALDIPHEQEFSVGVTRVRIPGLGAGAARILRKLAVPA